MVIGNLSNLNSCLSSLMVSSGSWVCTSDGLEGKQHPLSLLALGANPCPMGGVLLRGAVTGREAGGGAMLWMRQWWAPLLFALIKCLALGSSRTINPNVLAKLQPA